ncbi:hypothetical protein Saro_2549 [Novosphingobium aromaticivorans DSM 12444]|uniref:Uncharacterized protein n=1 Tax=Novosphingobium aromaticivorans (strain ATCC 700278 / DSM 12444 / CCUG 56034 / CIP 105152 / NBRC 16084 / F199) TaxID=279238 RepID=Q2G588_NOVAD|nr:hypothetical protein Saro_2549 [Novosphingobium aromaticivorans DSM 12444]
MVKDFCGFRNGLRVQSDSTQKFGNLFQKVHRGQFLLRTGRHFRFMARANRRREFDARGPRFQQHRRGCPISGHRALSQTCTCGASLDLTFVTLRARHDP